ncbi:4-deoxy-4-formamido-L-arabinose-phosphoundecaprenol deformylase [Pseudomonas parafulva]|uniref:Probable 4-deoxy-4-formamido-L-arabinose-phosphoundecaprenol deformylase ArnD n=1 Tax=Pseudomonas parafulva TaxID=157782 RepID=A0AAI8KB61_9PSED|nr:4-deoxy-4-formamido-L-arabinose-phosphoundecaprenol deformylase [Pseudomonas parafulva]AXO88660.1 4-deoxy-4-formamido-L-arabinose-phosphoundecaprenol deformylase [Pseudomonas parafulva]
MSRVGLRIDVDTFTGTREGVPALLDLLDAAAVKATFFFSVGPDNMGRHLWRLARPAFLHKMLRSKAASLYGWDVLLAGTAWPGKSIGNKLAPIMRRAQEAGHEIGLHAWDHYAWQAHAGRWPDHVLVDQVRQGKECLEDIIGQSVTCSAAPGWRADTPILSAKQALDFRYNSDCRGCGIFLPLLSDECPGTPQIPVSLPTFDEMTRPGLSLNSFNELILDQLTASRDSVYTVHAEVEGRSMASGFEQLLKRAAWRGIDFKPLGTLLPQDIQRLPIAPVVRGAVAGREGWVGVRHT